MWPLWRGNQYSARGSSESFSKRSQKSDFFVRVQHLFFLKLTTNTIWVFFAKLGQTKYIFGLDTSLNLWSEMRQISGWFISSCFSIGSERKSYRVLLSLVISCISWHPHHDGSDDFSRTGTSVLFLLLEIEKKKEIGNYQVIFPTSGHLV